MNNKNLIWKIPFLVFFVSCAILIITGCEEDVNNDDGWDAFTLPTIVYINRDAAGSGQLFDQHIPDPETHVRAIARNVSQLLYKHPGEVPALTKITLIIEYFDGIAWKSGDRPEITIGLSSKYMQSYSDSGKDLLYEIDGILHHEIAHGYQYDDGNRYSEIHGVIEGVADTVRFYAGYIDISSRHNGGHWTDGYKTTAFFFAWIEDEKHSDFLYELNQSLDPDDGIDWSWDDIERITGEPVSSLWSQYQDSF